MVLVLVGAFAWGAYFVVGFNVLDRGLEPIADILDDILTALIGLAGLWWTYRVLRPSGVPG